MGYFYIDKAQIMTKVAVDASALKALVTNVKSLFGAVDAAAVPPATPPTAGAPTPNELQDGTKVLIDGDVAEGSKITIVAEDGSEMSAPDGECTLKDGSVITVKDGVIMSVVNPQDPATAEMGEALTKLQADYAALQGKYEELLKSSQAMSKFKEDILKDFDSVRKIQKEMFAVVEVMAGLPEEKATEQKAGMAFERQNRAEQLALQIKEVNKKS